LGRALSPSPVSGLFPFPDTLIQRGDFRANHRNELVRNERELVLLRGDNDDARVQCGPKRSSDHVPILKSAPEGKAIGIAWNAADMGVRGIGGASA
jgi:hypothetical protein